MAEVYDKDPSKMPQEIIKILIVGDPGTGKSSIIKRYVDNYFSEDHGNVNGTDYAIKRVNVNGTEVLLQLWDIAGQARFGASASRVYYKEALGAVLVYECSRPKTFDSAAKWKSEIDKMVKLPVGEGAIPVVLVGNKCDVEVGDGQVDRLYLDRFCAEHGFLSWYDTSAYSGEGIEEALRCLVEKILTYPDIFQRKRERNSKFKPEMRKDSTDTGCC